MPPPKPSEARGPKDQTDESTEPPLPSHSELAFEAWLKCLPPGGELRVGKRKRQGAEFTATPALEPQLEESNPTGPAAGYGHISEGARHELLKLLAAEHRIIGASRPQSQPAHEALPDSVKDKPQPTDSQPETKPSASAPTLRVSIPVLSDRALLNFVKSLDPGTLKVELGPRPKPN